MVSNHSLKKQTRELMARSKGELSYTEALAIAQQQQQLPVSHGPLSRFADSSKLSSSALRLTSFAAGELSAGRDLIVFGSTSSGRSTLADAVVRAAGLRTAMFLRDFDSYGEGFVPTDLQAIAVPLPSVVPEVGRHILRMMRELVVVDELAYAVDAELIEVFKYTPSRLIVIHAMSLRQAEQRLELLTEGIELRDPLYLEAALEGSSGIRSARLY